MKVFRPVAHFFAALSICSRVDGIQVSRLDQAQPGGLTSETAGVPARRAQMHFSRDSVTYFCVAVLIIQCMAIYTALSVSRNCDELSGETEPSLLTQTLTATNRCSVYPPMMCMLFVAYRMYVLATSNGLGEPQFGYFGVTLQFLIVLTLPMFTAHWYETEGEPGMRFEELAGEPTDVHVQMDAQRFCEEDERATFEALQVLAVAFIYCGIIGVIVGIFTYPQGVTKVSVAVLCTVFLTIVYFAVYFLGCMGSLMDMEAQGYVLRAASRQALVPIRKAPMLAVLFLASRMRALQLDPPHGLPSQTEQCSFVVISAALFAETLAALVIGATGDEQTHPYGLPSFKSATSIHACMHFFGFVVYCGLAPVVKGILGATTPDGLEAPLSSTVSAVLQLSALYFLVQILQWAILMSEDLLDSLWTEAKAVVLAADVSVRLCPLISILFLACRLRALQLTNHRGHPPVWAEQAMFMTVYAMVVQTLMCIVLPLAMGSAAVADGDGCLDWKMEPLMLAYVVTVMKYIALFCLHGGALMVSIAIFTMTQEGCEADYHPDGLLERKTLRHCFLVTLVSLGFALFFSFAKVLGILFKITVEGFDEALLGVQITVRMAAISLTRGWVNLADVFVENPRYPAEDGCGTWAAPHLLKVKRICADLDMVKLFSSRGTVFEFEEIILEDVDINYVKPWKVKDNVTCILDHIKSRKHPPDEEQTAEPPAKIARPVQTEACEPSEEERSEVQVIFRKVKIQGITAHLFVSGPSGLGGHMNIALADLDFPDFAQQLSNTEGEQDSGKMREELVIFIVRSLMETVAANVGPGKTLHGAVKGVGFAAKTVSTCLQGVCSPGKKPHMDVPIA